VSEQETVLAGLVDAPDDGPANARADDNGNRTYTHPLTGEAWPSVTTILKVLGKDALPYWYAKVVAEHAMDTLPALLKASRTPGCGTIGDEACRACRDCATWGLRNRPNEVRDAAGDLGRAVHKAAEYYVLHGRLPDIVTDQMRPFIDGYLRWREHYQPTYEAAEATVINRKYGYAGTLDGIVRLGWCPPKHRDLVGLPLMMDIKTGRGVYREAAFQMGGYRAGEAVMLRDGTEIPLPATETTAIVLHLRPEHPDGYHVVPADAGPRALRQFLSALDIWTGEQGPGFLDRAMTNPRTKKTKEEVA
jgi:hypothetical protein